jgi:lipopolysaccharide transport protein LptA
MPVPHPSNRVRPLVAAASAALLAASGLAASVSTRAAADTPPTFADCGTITVDSKKWGGTFPKGGTATTSFTGGVTIKVAGCDMEIKAARAETTSLDTNDSSWTLDGNVRIRAEQQQSRLSSDHAVVQFRNGEIYRITITGDPAEFEQQRPGSNVITRGRAREIVYEAGTGTVRLVEDAWLSDGSKEIKTPQLVYDIRKAEIRNSGTAEGGSRTPSGGNDRVIITIDPKASKGAKKNGQDDKPPATTPAPTGQNDASSGTSPAPAKSE